MFFFSLIEDLFRKLSAILYLSESNLFERLRHFVFSGVTRILLNIAVLFAELLFSNKKINNNEMYRI